MLRLVHRRSLLRAIGFALPLAMLAPAAIADQPGQNGAPGTKPTVAEAPDAVDIFIGELEQRIIRSYYERQLVTYRQSPEWHEYEKNKGKKKHKHKGLPPGLAKKGTLPPGLAKQLARNGHLPPGLEYRSLPHDLIVELPPLQHGYRYVIVDDRVMLIKAASNLILDVLTVAALDLLD
ncbi:MAG TPA: hypothetical protein VJ790_16090 [Dongiaceae bacterium]|nr:hypothetical protein [Dongiaceae bacterium]